MHSRAKQRCRSYKSCFSKAQPEITGDHFRLLFLSSSAEEIKDSNVSFRESSCSEAIAKFLITSITCGIKGPKGAMTSCSKSSTLGENSEIARSFRQKDEVGDCYEDQKSDIFPFSKM